MSSSSWRTGEAASVTQPQHQQQHQPQHPHYSQQQQQHPSFTQQQQPNNPNNNNNNNQTDALLWNLPKSKKHRKKFTPVGPAGLWFEHHKSLKKQRKQQRARQQQQGGAVGGGEEQDLVEEDAVVLEDFCHLSPEDDEEEDDDPNKSNDNNKRESKTKKSAAAAGFLSTTCMAWTAMQCLSQWCTPHMGLSILHDPERRYEIVRRHTPNHVLLLQQIVTVHQQQQQQQQQHPPRDGWTIPPGRSLLVMVEHVVIHSWLLWTVTLKDETGTTIRAWCDPTMIEQEETRYFTSSSSNTTPGDGGNHGTADETTATDNHNNNSSDQKVLQEGYVWELVDCSIVLKGENHDEDAEEAPSHSVLSTKKRNHSQRGPQDSNSLERMLLVGRNNIRNCWTPEHLEKINDNHYVAWMEERNRIDIHDEPMYMRTMGETWSHTATAAARADDSPEAVDPSFQIQPRLLSMHDRHSPPGRNGSTAETVDLVSASVECGNETAFPQTQPAFHCAQIAPTASQLEMATMQQPEMRMEETPHPLLDQSEIAVVTNDKTTLEHPSETRDGTAQSPQLCAKRLALSQKGESTQTSITNETRNANKENASSEMTPKPTQKRKRRRKNQKTIHSPLPCLSPLFGSTPQPRDIFGKPKAKRQPFMADMEDAELGCDDWDDDNDDDNDNASEGTKPKGNNNAAKEPVSVPSPNRKESEDEDDDDMLAPSQNKPGVSLLFSEQGLDEIGLAWTDDDDSRS